MKNVKGLLKNWDVVILRNREMFFVNLEHNVLVMKNNCRQYCKLSDYDLELCNVIGYSGGLYDVMEIYRTETQNSNIFVVDNQSMTNNLIWKRNNIDWSKIEVDTKVVVKYSDGGTGNYYFAEYKDGKVCVFALGATSFSANNSVPHYKYDTESVSLWEGD